MVDGGRATVQRPRYTNRVQAVSRFPSHTQQAFSSAFLAQSGREVPNGDMADVHLNSNRCRSMDPGIWSISYLNCFWKPRVGKANRLCNTMCYIGFGQMHFSCAPLRGGESFRVGEEGLGEGGLFTKSAEKPAPHASSQFFVQTGHCCSLLSKPQKQACSTRKERGAGRWRTKLTDISAWASMMWDADTRDHFKFPQKA